MAPPAMEILTRSRYDTALRTNSQNTRNQRTRLVSAGVSMNASTCRRLFGGAPRNDGRNCPLGCEVITSPAGHNQSRVVLTWIESDDENEAALRSNYSAGLVRSGDSRICPTWSLLHTTANRVHSGLARRPVSRWPSESAGFCAGSPERRHC